MEKLTLWEIAQRAGVSAQDARRWYDARTTRKTCLAPDARMIFGTDTEAEIADRLALGYPKEWLARQFKPATVDRTYAIWKRHGHRIWPENSARLVLREPARVIRFPA